MDKWGPVLVAVLGAGGIGSLLVIFFVPAPKRYDAAQTQAAERIIELQGRVTRTEEDIKTMRTLLQQEVERRAQSDRQRDALYDAHDLRVDDLVLSAEMHEKHENPPAALLKRWQSAKHSKDVLEELKDDEKSV